MRHMWAFFVFGLALALALAPGCAEQKPGGWSAPTTSEPPVADKASVTNTAAKLLPTGAATPKSKPRFEGEPAVPGIIKPDAKLVAKLRAAYEARGSKYVPRTHHTFKDGKAKFVNRLILETSPYLLQHAHNPMNWRPWGDAAFEAARAQGKPVLLSVGYSTCHWCHVMERESFEDLEIATYLNKNFIAIKVDREERPDVDNIYMAAVRRLSGRGGWPMTVVLTPDREAFFGGTYFPPRAGARGGRKGFLEIAKSLKERYDSDREGVVAEAKALTQKLQAAARPRRAEGVPGADALERAARVIAQRLDPEWGGFGKRPKFPRPVTPRFMLRYFRRTKDAQALAAVELTLNKMADGGMHDQIGGGFHRYSTDGRWLVPHFEKMLYDNAQLASLYLEAWQSTHTPRFAEVVRSTLDYVLREMTAPHGGFYSATDADSPAPGGHDEEGLYFTWTLDELSRLLGFEEAALVATRYAVTAAGNFEGRSILWTPKSWAETVKETGVPEPALRARIAAAGEKMYAERATREPPLRDDKVILAWNSLMVSALAQAGLALPDGARYLAAAQKAADFLLGSLRGANGRLHRTYMDGRARHNAYLIDYATLIAALLDVFEASGELRYLDAARALQTIQDRHYLDAKGGGYFTVSDDHERLLTRDKPAYDGAMPAGNSFAARNLLRLAELSGDTQYTTRAEGVLKAFARRLRSGGSAVPQLLGALDMHLDTVAEVVLVAPVGQSDAVLRQALGATFLPNKVVIRATEGADLAAKAKGIPLLADKVAMDGKPTAYVCERGRCERPTHDPATLRAQLDGMVRPLYADRSPEALPVAEAGPAPKAWQYNPKTNKHWNPAHGHWHNGRPPAGKGG